MKLITDKRHNGFVSSDFFKYLTKPVPLTAFTQAEADELEQTLREAVKKYPAFGISANQLGIDKRACLIINSLTEKDYIFLLNPVLIEKSEQYFIFWESCLSLHKTMEKPIRTYRHEKIKIKTDNLGEMEFQINPEKDQEAPDEFKVSLETLQTAVVQHEIDHLDGFTIKDRNSLNWTQRKTNNYGRNDKIVMKSPTGELVEVKYKKANDYFIKGYEII